MLVLDDDREHERAALRERDAQLVVLHKNIVQINEMMIDLAALTEDSGQSLDALDTRTYDIKTQTQAACDELRVADKSQRRRRNMLCGALLGVVVAGLAATAVGAVLGLVPRRRE